MKVVVRCIYYKPVTPSCDIIDMDDNTWREFLLAEDGETTSMSIYDLNGRLIERFNIGAHFNQVQLNVSSYSPGIYLYEYNGKSNRFIVQ